MSELWAWNEKLETGVKEIDDQHKGLIEKVNHFIAELNSGQRQKASEEIIDFLKSYVVDHFQAEEELQRAVEYPFYTAHKALHKSFVDRIDEMKARVGGVAMTPEASFELSTLVNEWLVLHIGMADMALAEFIKNKKIKEF